MSDEDVPDGYKMTEIGAIPEDWTLRKLGSVAHVKYGRGRTKDVGQIPVYGSGGVYAYTKEALVECPTIIIGRKGTAGAAYLTEGPSYPSDTTFYLDFKETIDLRFLYANLLLRPISGQHAKTTLPSLQKADLENLLIPLPSLHEQRKIATILSTVQEAKEKTQAVIDALKELKKSMMEHLFTYGPVPLDEVDQVELKETEIGEIPHDWTIRRIDDVAEVNPENRNPAESAPDELFTYIDIASIESETGKMANLKRIKGIDAPSRARRVVRYGDVVMSTVRPYLKAFTTIGPEYDNQICSTGFAVLRPKDGVVPEFLLASLFTSSVMNQFKANMRGANYPAINQDHVKKTLISLPPRPIQIRIAEIISALYAHINAEVDKMSCLEITFRSLLEDLMSGKIRVNNLEV